MATGDDAIAAGMDVLDPSTDLVKDGAEEINRTRDYIAEKTADVTTVAKGGTGSTTAAGARSNLGVQAAVTAVAGATATPTDDELMKYGTGGRVNVGAPISGGNAANKTYVDDLVNTRASVASVNAAQSTANDAYTLAAPAHNGDFNNAPYNRNITWTRRSAWLGDNGQLGYASSSERYKENIVPFDVTDEQVGLLTLVSYTRPGQGATEVGLIAERLDESGLGWAVFYDDEGRPEGIEYAMVALVLIPYVQRLAARVSALEALAETGA